MPQFLFKTAHFPNCPITGWNIATYIPFNLIALYQCDSFINQFLPDLFTVIDALYYVGALEKKFNYNDADALIGLAYALIYN